MTISQRVNRLIRHSSPTFCPEATTSLRMARFTSGSREVHIELYTDEKNPEVEALVETVLDAHGIFYDKTEVWIDSEKLYEVLYSFETED